MGAETEGEAWLKDVETCYLLAFRIADCYVQHTLVGRRKYIHIALT